MKSLLEQLKEILDTFKANDIPYALCGGIAVNVYGHPRTTKDIDFLVLEEDIEKIYQALEKIGFLFRAGPIPFGWGTETYRELYRISKPDSKAILTVDLLIVTPIFQDVWQTKQTFEWMEKTITVVSLEGLAKMKWLGGRYQDLADLENLGLEVKVEKLDDQSDKKEED